MRVLIVTGCFPPPAGAPQARLSSLAAAWAADGDAVTVLTGMPSQPAGVPPSSRRALLRRERTDGYRVIRTWRYAPPDAGIARATLGPLSFLASSVLLGGRASGPADVVVVSSPDFCSLLSGWLLARRKRARLAVQIGEPRPATGAGPGARTSRRVAWLRGRLELAACAAADQVVVVGEQLRDDLIRRGVPAAKVRTVSNGGDPGRLPPAAPASPEVRARLGAGSGDCLVLYAGPHGISRALPAIAEAAALTEAPVPGDPAGGGGSVRFAFVGDGADKRRLEQRVADLGLRHVVLLPGVPDAELPGLLAAADICLVPLRRVPPFVAFVPSGIFEYLAAGKAVIGSVTGDAARVLAEAGAVVVPPEDSVSLAAAITTLAGSPRLRAALGQQGRAFAQRRHDQAALAREYRTILDLDGDGDGVGAAGAVSPDAHAEEPC